MGKTEKESASNRRKLTGLTEKILTAFMVIGSIFHLYTGGFGMLSTMSQRSLHLLFMITPAFFLYAASHKTAKRLPWYDVLLGILSFAACLYIFITWRFQTMRLGDPTLVDYFFWGVLVIAVLEAARRTAGNALAAVAAILLAYCCFGKYLPGGLAHRGYSIPRIVSFFSSTAEGIFGVPLGVSASLIVLFVIFGAVLNATGGGKFFIDSTYAFAGKFRGGTAKTAVVASALMGMISGSPIANVVTTGTFTIPLMKKGGFDSNLSAAICAIASAGGILMPPVMGAAAFIMAEYLGVSYGEVIKAALIPSILFYASIFIVVDLKATKNGLHGIPKDQLPDIKEVLRNGWYLMIPIVALIAFLMMSWSANKAVFWSIIMLFAISFVKKATRMTQKKVIDALLSGAKESIPVAIACAAAGLIVGSLALTGLGVKFSSAVISLSQGSTIIALFLSMIASLILGMGMPATAVYILTASLLVPPLTSLGISAISAHFFVFYFSVISCITPPVALTAYAAAGLANTDPGKAGWTSFYYGILAYIVPYVFVYDPVFLWQGSTIKALVALVTGLIGIFGIGAALEGFMRTAIGPIKRLILFAGGVIALFPSYLLSAIGIVILGITYWIDKKTDRPSSVTLPSQEHA